MSQQPAESRISPRHQGKRNQEIFTKLAIANPGCPGFGCCKGQRIYVDRLRAFELNIETAGVLQTHSLPDCGLLNFQRE